jgi:membrane protein implicated in regulation of membrane protease activity
VFTVYLACLIFGGSLLTFTLFAGGDADADGDLDFDAHGDLDVDADLDAAVAHGVDVEIHGEGLTAAVKFLSFRNIVFFTAFFGLTGTALEMAGVPTWVSAPLSLGLGTAAAAACHILMGYLRKSETGRLVETREFEGRHARVTVEVARGRRGKVSVIASGQSHDLLAFVAEEAAEDRYPAGETVTVVRVEEGTAYVASKAFID